MGELFIESLHGLSPEVAILAMAAVFAAAFLRGFTGFGFALAAVPSLSLLFDPIIVVPLTLLLAVLAGIQVLHRLRDLVDWRSVWILLAGSLIGSPLGVWLLTALHPNGLRVATGFVLMAAVGLLWRQPRLSNAPAAPLGIMAGIVSGILNGSTGMGGPPVILYFLSSNDSVAVARASLILYFFFSSIGTLAFDAGKGLIDLHVLVLTLSLFPAVYLGNWLGTRSFDGSSAATYRRVALAALFLLALVAVGRALYAEL
jgi:uncharacterized protein